MGKKAGKQVQSHNERPKTTSTLSQPAALDMSSVLTRFSPSGRLFAQLSIAVDADTCRVYEVQSGQCVGRWASSSASERVTSIEWVDLPSSSSPSLSNEEKPNRGKKRRKGGNGENSSSNNNNEDKSISLGADSSFAQDTSATASTSAANNAEEASVVSTMEVLALGLKNASILLLHPTQSTIVQTISHSSITSPPISLSFPSSSSKLQPFLLWSCTANGQLSAWALPRLSGAKGKLVAQYDTQCSSCSTIAVRYAGSSKPQVNGATNEGGSAQQSSTTGTTVQVLLGQFSIKLFEMPLPSTKHSLSDGFERPRIHLRAEASGHASEVAQIAWLKGDVGALIKDSSIPHVQFVSIAKGDRFVSLWSAPTAASADGPASGTLVATLGLDEEPRRIALSTNNTVICCISTDAARIISLDSSNPEQQASAQGTSIKQRRKSVRSLRILSTVSSSQSDSPCTDALLPATPAGTICVASGIIKPALDSVSYRDQTGAYIPALQLASRQQGSLNGANGHVGAEAPRAAYNEARQSTVLSAEAARDPSIATGSAPGEVDPTAEPTIAERLKDLDMQDQQHQQGGELAVQDHTKRKMKRGNGKYRIADALSTTQSLVQALHSADVRLLETCLAEKNPKIIRATVRRVPGTLVLPLVEALVERLSRRRKGAGEGSGGVDASRGQVLIEWLRNVLIVHLGYLITIPSLVERLSALHATLESRMSFHSQLLALSGRLDLVVSQIEIRANPIQDVVQQQQKSSAPAKNLKAGSMAVRKYVEGEEESESDESSSDDDDDEDDEAHDGIEAAEEGDEEDIEDLVMANGDLSGDEIGDDDDEEDDDEESDDDEDEDEIPALRKSKKKGAEKPRMNGFLDIEAEESENEGSDEDGNPIRSSRSSGGVKLNGVINEDSLDEDSEDLDQYESDFINDDSEEEEEESGEDDDDEDEDEE